EHEGYVHRDRDSLHHREIRRGPHGEVPADALGYVGAGDYQINPGLVEEFFERERTGIGEIYAELLWSSRRVSASGPCAQRAQLDLTGHPARPIGSVAQVLVKRHPARNSPHWNAGNQESSLPVATSPLPGWRGCNPASVGSWPHQSIHGCQ